jgi:hypothetical protein
MRGVRPIPFIVLAVWIVGCSDPYAGRNSVTGTVTLEGAPLKKGLIQFLPTANQGTESGAVIEDGKYEILREGGLKPGLYLIRITAADGKTPAQEEIGGPSGNTNLLTVDLVPEEWNTKSEKTVEVKASGPNVFDFAIPVAIDPKTRKPKK